MPQHAERRILPYSSAQMFDLVAEVERYPEFLPWCLGTRVTRREPGEPGIVEADMLIGFMMFRERFGSRVQLHRDEYRIEVNYTHGPFRYLVNRWRFRERSDGCEVDFFVDFEFRSRLLKRVMGALFAEAVDRMVRSFESRARQLYGAPAMEATA
ncbi:MAG: type II toxin-antitoxin system RatA family toxin [Rhodospirillales bacterium]|nr:type II toxin-antitoxin system RatA family toxin [Rhodospirillales bacterium]